MDYYRQLEFNSQNLDGIIFDNRHYYLVKVFYEDTDAAQIVYHANYLKYFERARTSLLNLLKIDQINLKKNFDIILVVRKADISWFKPAILNDTLLIETCLKYAKNSSIVIKQKVYRDYDTDKTKVLLVSGLIQIVAMSSTLKVRRISKVLKNSFFQNK